LTLPASANSSWIWLTFAPAYILPFVAVGTVIVETVGIYKYGVLKKDSNPKNILSLLTVVVCLVNLLSFVGPLVFSVNIIYDDFASTGDGGSAELMSWAWEKYIQNWPSFIVGLGFLFLTLCIEMPVILALFERYTEDKKRFVKAIALSNAVTTMSVVIIERTLCQGHW
jgi:hypothetical protein